MNRRFAELKDQLQQVPVSRVDVEEQLQKMRHDLEAAEKIREDTPDWALRAAHEAILAGCTALVRAHGYRVKVKAQMGHHYTSIRFAQLALSDHTALFDQADMIRRRRHTISYGALVAVSVDEVNEALTLAKTLLPVFTEAARGALPPEKSEKRPSKGQAPA